MKIWKIDFMIAIIQEMQAGKIPFFPREYEHLEQKDRLLLQKICKKQLTDNQIRSIFLMTLDELQITAREMGLKLRE